MSLQLFDHDINVVTFKNYLKLAINVNFLVLFFVKDSLLILVLKPVNFYIGISNFIIKLNCLKINSLVLKFYI